MTKYNPSNIVSKQLLHSLIRKLFIWLQCLQVDTKSGEFEALCWELQINEKNSFCKIKYNNENIILFWDGNLLYPSDVSCTHKNIENLEEHLEWFVGLEKVVYDTMEKFSKELQKKNVF